MTSRAARTRFSRHLRGGLALQLATRSRAESRGRTNTHFQSGRTDADRAGSTSSSTATSSTGASWWRLPSSRPFAAGSVKGW